MARILSFVLGGLSRTPATTHGMISYVSDFPVPAHFSDPIEIRADAVRVGDYLEYTLVEGADGSRRVARGMTTHISALGADDKIRIDLAAVPPHSLRLFPAERVTVRRRDP